MWRLKSASLLCNVTKHKTQCNHIFWGQFGSVVCSQRESLAHHEQCRPCNSIETCSIGFPEVLPFRWWFVLGLDLTVDKHCHFLAQYGSTTDGRAFGHLMGL